jgi:hypothetical protein
MLLPISRRRGRRSFIINTAHRRVLGNSKVSIA